MKKKIRAIIVMLVCVFSLAACGDGTVKPMIDNPGEVFNNDLIFLTEQIVQLGIAGDDLANFDNLRSDDRETMSAALKQYMAQMGINASLDLDVLIKGAHSYESARKELGDNVLEAALSGRLQMLEPITAEDIEYDVKADELVAQVHFKTLDENGHDGIIEFIIDKDYHVTSITVNTALDLGESMQRAGVNTLIGMGTVFIMLILIAIIISMLKFVPMLFERKAPAEENEKSMDNAIAGIVEREEAVEETDDAELIAVIAAAIAAFEGSGSSSTDGFTVRSIRRIR